MFPDNEQQIVNYAESTGLSLAAYLRNLGMGYKPASVLDAQAVEDRAKINAAQCRLGNLVKLALSNPEKQGLYGDIDVARELKRLTIAINQLQEEMFEIVEKVILAAKKFSGCTLPNKAGLTAIQSQPLFSG